MTSSPRYVEYGDESAVDCPRCGSHCLRPVNFIGGAGKGVRCEACQEWIFLRYQAIAHPAATVPQPQPAGAHSGTGG